MLRVSLCMLLMTAQAQEVNQLAFLTGCWQMAAGPLVIEEVWGKPATDGLLGFSRTLKNGKTVFSEFMRIDRRAGGIDYTPRIGTGRDEKVSFKLMKLTGDEVVFENQGHDFPQRILYRKTPGGLAARIEGKQNGKERGEDFPYRRVSCDPN
ncbi:MAG: hypothetical protein K2X03_27120 [Bryobacteraceae bacterium]|nr:hypothetical protein [Bryobacteraceae bacterium]